MLAGESFCKKARIPVSQAIRTALQEDLYLADKMLMQLILLHWFVASTVMAYTYGFYLLGFIGGGLISLTCFFCLSISSRYPVFPSGYGNFFNVVFCHFYSTTPGPY